MAAVDESRSKSRMLPLAVVLLKYVAAGAGFSLLAKLETWMNQRRQTLLLQQKL